LLAKAGSNYEKEGDPGEVEVVDLRTGKLLFTLNRHPGSVQGVCFTPDGNRLVSFCQEKVNVWDMATGKQLWSTREHAREVSLVIVHPDCNRLVTADCEGEVIIWDVKRDRKLATLQVNEWT